MNRFLLKAQTRGCIIVYEDGSEEKVGKRPEKMLAEECLENGCSLAGREEAFRYLTKSRQKPGVLVNEMNQEFWFPIISKTCRDCQWLSYYHVIKAFPNEDGTCTVLFDNGHRETVNCNSRTLKLQLKRCYIFLQQINKNY